MDADVVPIVLVLEAQIIDNDLGCIFQILVPWM
jgi:hypothetical protein